MPWIMSSVDGSVALNLQVNDNGGASGALTVNGVLFTVTGQWTANGNAPTHQYSAFTLSGTQPGANQNFVVAVGRMDGPGDQPYQIQIAGGSVSTMAPAVNSFNETLLPNAINNQSLVQQTFSQSGCIIVVDATRNPLTCTACYIGNRAVDTSGILTDGDPVTINIPRAAPAGKPVCIVFANPDMTHFANPPLAEAHRQIQKLLLDTVGEAPSGSAGLVLQYYNGYRGIAPAQTQVINFNHGHENGPDPRTHAGVTIKPG